MLPLLTEASIEAMIKWMFSLTDGIPSVYDEHSLFRQFGLAQQNIVVNTECDAERDISNWKGPLRHWHLELLQSMHLSDFNII